MKILISLIVALFSVTCFATVTADQEYILNTQMGYPANRVQMGTLINRAQNIIVGKYSFAVQGGGVTGTNTPIYLLTDLSNKKSFVIIPKGAIITNVWINTITTKLSTAVDPNNIGMSVLKANDLLATTDGSTAFYQLFAGAVLKGTSTGWIKVPTDSKVSITIGNNAITAGKFNAYIEYVLGD